MYSPITIYVIATSSVVLLIAGTSGYPTNDKNPSDGPNLRQSRAITQVHDTLVYKPRTLKSNVHSADKPRRSSSKYHPKKYKIIPADKSLRHEFFSEKIEEELGHAKIHQRIRRNEPYNSPLSKEQAQYNQVQGHVPLWTQQILSPFNAVHTSYSSMDKKRVQDLEEVFRILARRDGPLLEQMLSLRDAIDRFYGIFEFMGVAKMPPPQRDAAVRKILERSLNIDIENAAKRT